MGRIVSETELDALVAEQRRAGATIAFANGCFDILRRTCEVPVGAAAEPIAHRGGERR
jgi:bifunctional ADP-heptose synthase (sugar kinase/adenylyltransferase)